MKKPFSLLIVLPAVFFPAIKTAAQSANTSLSNLAQKTSINSGLFPKSSNLYNLGADDSAWKNLFLGGFVYIDNKRFISNPGTGNNFIGTYAGKSITSGVYNTAIGYNALYNTTNGASNTALGYSALYNNTIGQYNTALGESALYNNSSGNYNTATGKQSLYSNTTGSYNCATGHSALFNNTTGNYNTAGGYGALAQNQSGIYNTATGYQALIANKNSYNTAHGAFALWGNTSGYNNTADGVSALYHNTTGVDNTASGLDALSANTTGNSNTGIGDDALVNTTASDGNTAVGANAGALYNNGYYNVFVGANTDVNGADYYNDIAIGQGTICTDVSQVTIGNSASSSYRVYANWSNISDGRFKKNIHQNVPGLIFINKLQPVTYTLDATGIDNFLHQNKQQDKQSNEQARTAMNNALSAKEKTIFTGFIAQDVEKAARSLNFDFSGVDAAKNDKDVYGLRYAEFVVPLVKAVQELSIQNDALKTKNDELEARISKLEVIMNTTNQPASVSLASLAQNAPNPFGSSTNVGYTIPANSSSAKIIITDNKGVVLKQISLNTKGKGSINIDAATLAAGAYHYSLYINEKLIDTKQMLLAK